MKITALLFGFTYAQDRTILPTERLSNIQTGLSAWITDNLPPSRRTSKIEGKLNRIVDFMQDLFNEECAILTPPNNVEEEEIDAEIDQVRTETDPVERMKQYVRVLKRVNRVYLADCQKFGRNRKRAEKLGRKLENAAQRQL